MRTNNKFIRFFVGLVASLLLLVPGLLTAAAWKVTLNLEIALAAIAICVAVAVWAPRLKWISAVVASLLIAEPPYPHWLHSSEERGLYFDFYPNYTLQDLSIGTIIFSFLLAMLLFAVIFWAIGSRNVAKP